MTAFERPRGALRMQRPSCVRAAVGAVLAASIVQAVAATWPSMARGIAA